jgi:hypothetical protein
VKLTDEETLRRRLHAEADQAEVGPAPVEAVFRRYRAARTRRLSALGAGTAVLAAAVAVLVIRTSGRPAGRPPGLSAPPGSGVFAAGTANGKRWQLSAVNWRTPVTGACPGSSSTAERDPLQPGFLPGLPLGNAGSRRSAPDAQRPGRLPPAAAGGDERDRQPR